MRGRDLQRRFVHLALALCALVGCGAAGDAGDAGDARTESDAASGGACGAVPASGVCEGSTLRKCDGDAVLELACATLGGRTDGRCLRVGSEAACGVALEAPCRHAEQHGDHQHITYHYCDGDGAACLLGPNNASRCAAGVGACDGAAIGRCRGEVLVVDCRNGQATGFDCAAFRGRCDAARGACVGLPAEMPCDRSSRLCADGLTCWFPRGRSTGVCSAAAM